MCGLISVCGQLGGVSVDGCRMIRTDCYVPTEAATAAWGCIDVSVWVTGCGVLTCVYVS